MYFKDFPTTSYIFGSESNPVITVDISAYADILDDIKDNLDFYQYYDLYEQRPDQLSFELYDDASFYWTFFFMNDHIRRQGWPIKATELQDWIYSSFSKTVITTRDTLDNIFSIGDTITGVSSGVTGTITKRVEDLGQIFIEGTKNFTDGELIEDPDGNSVTVFSAVEEYNAVKHYLDTDAAFVDIDPTQGPGALYTPVTYYDYMVEENDKLRRIKVIKPETINTVISAYKQAIRGQ
jgi:hypothetical protein